MAGATPAQSGRAPPHPERAIDPTDPALAVGSAKELIQSTAKVVLAERGLPVSEKADLPEEVAHPQQGRPSTRRQLRRARTAPMR